MARHLFSIAALAGALLLSGIGASGDSAREKQLDAIFAPLADAKSPGLAVLVRQNGQTVFERGYGVRDLRSLRPIDARTNFRLASCTKQFTAMAVMLLVHDGKMRYDTTLAEIFPGFPAYGKSIAVRNLLNHTSGLADYEDLMQPPPGQPSRWSDTHQIQDAEVLALLERQSATKFPPGAKWEYSNSGYVLLGMIIAKASAQPFGAFLRQRIFAPLGMNHTLVFEKGKNEVQDRAYGHSKSGEGWQETDQSPTSATLGDGGIYSSLEDLAKWDEALARHTLLSESEMRDALIPVAPAGGPARQPDGKPVSYGFGWFLDPYQEHPRMWHSGGTMGFRTNIQRFLDNNHLTIIVLCNRSDLDPGALALKVVDILLARPQP